MTDPERPSMRASDRDREQVAERLRLAFDEGRLGLTEYDERVRDAYAAVTFADLAELTADLPAPEPPSSAPKPAARERPAEKRRKVETEWRRWAGTAFLLTGIWLVISLAAGEVVFFWPILPMGIWAVVLLAGMVSGDGNGPEEEGSGRGEMNG